MNDMPKRKPKQDVASASHNLETAGSRGAIAAGPDSEALVTARSGALASAKGATAVKDYDGGGEPPRDLNPALSWDDAWRRVQRPLWCKMQQVADFLQVEGQFVVSSVKSYEHDEMFGYTLEIGIASEASQNMAPMILIGGLHDGACHDGVEGDFFISFELQGPCGMALGRYAPAMYTEGAYVRTVEALLERIEGYAVVPAMQEILGVAGEQRDKHGWVFVWEPKPLKPEEREMVTRYASLVYQQGDHTARTGSQSAGLATEIADLEAAFRGAVGDEIEHYRHFIVGQKND